MTTLKEGVQVKTCTKCGETKEVSEFYNSKLNRDGYYSYCKNCCKKKSRLQYSIKGNQYKDPNYNLIYRLTNRDKIKNQRQKYRYSNREKINKARKDKQAEYTAREAKRYISKLQRTPSWANLEEIKKFYLQAALLTQTTGIPHHVDHIIPLQGKTVSGLHVEYNLQILTATDNIRKGNRLYGNIHGVPS